MTGLRHWPLAALELTTPRLRLHLASPGELDQLAELAVTGVHDPDRQPFVVAWTDAEPAERAMRVLQYHWGAWAGWKPTNWSLPLVAVFDGTVVGTQEIASRDFAIRREVNSGSWLGQEFHGLGFGTEMRAAVLHLAFAGLGAHYAVSEAFTDNPKSLGVSQKFGYREDGIEHYAVRGKNVVSQRLRLSREDWANHRHRFVEVGVEGLEPCLEMFGASAG